MLTLMHHTTNVPPHPFPTLEVLLAEPFPHTPQDMMQLEQRLRAQQQRAISRKAEMLARNGHGKCGTAVVRADAGQALEQHIVEGRQYRVGEVRIEVIDTGTGISPAYWAPSR